MPGKLVFCISYLLVLHATGWSLFIINFVTNNLKLYIHLPNLWRNGAI